MSEAVRGDGIVLVSKPAGITSHDMVDRFRRTALGARRKVGHAGTLDPFATGLLVLLVGRATRVQRFVMALDKTYFTKVRFGMTSDTGDPTGTLSATDVAATEQDVSSALPLLVGEISQQVPLTSAVKVGGERLYRRAHRGETIDTPVRSVRVKRLDLFSFDESRQFAELEIECSSGTYVRQLVADLGRLAGTGAYCETLERIAIGPFMLEHADEARLIPVTKALGFLPEHPLTAEQAGRVRHGGAVRLAEGAAAGDVVRLTLGDELIAVAETRGDLIQPITVLAS